ncbi:hypothetical protein SAMN05443572_1011472 [Myxococcus fulvus]|uniref:Lipoprotein n=1 Tax=Myxococcus fulvus TaxID=33 RepID=A0A511SSR0_MYXFU|nr:hypothetical protein [Myxococcus fulvus]GEN04984.1 hypothetical protein MFU01_00210 [Myxococcus fulvus]SET21673.1 hypothetical protein SAMN05443572_1011472 [Myxococcus fulvus]
MRGAFLLWLCLGVVGSGCHREVASGPSSRTEGLVGRTLPLLASPALRLTVAGKLGTRTVPVVLDVARPLSMVSQECFEGGIPPPEGTVRAPEIAGGFRAWPVVPLPALTVSGALVPLRTAGVSGEKPCSVTLGSDVLEPYALTVDPLRREVTFTASRSREMYVAETSASDAAREVHRVELSREPVGDWPLLAARVAQGESELTGPFVLSTREPFSRIALGPAEAQGLQPLETAANLPPRTFAVDSVDVAEGVGVRPLVVEAAGRWDSPSSLGRLGPDVWGRFTATLDAKGGVLVLRRPRVLAAEASEPRGVEALGPGDAESVGRTRGASPESGITSAGGTRVETSGTTVAGGSASSKGARPDGLSTPTAGPAAALEGTRNAAPAVTKPGPAATSAEASRAASTPKQGGVSDGSRTTPLPASTPGVGMSSVNGSRAASASTSTDGSRSTPLPASTPGAGASASDASRSLSPPAPGPAAGTSGQGAAPGAPSAQLSPRQRCSDAHGVFSEEACYGLHVRREPDGTVSVVGAVFRDLPEGGRVHLEPVGAEGQRLESGCAVGLSFPATSRGLTTQHRLPWPSLAQSLPACHAALTQAKDFRLSLYEEARQPECPTACAFVTETASRRTVCECQPTPLGEGVAAPSRKKTSREPPPEERELEPEDPR